MYQWKYYLAGLYEQELGVREGGVLSTMLLGEKNLLDAEVKQLYRTAGISHILAISGLHIAVIGMTLYRLLRKGSFGFWGSGIFAAVFMILYGMMTGMGYSSFRAVSMFCILLLGQAVGRSYDSLNAMGFTALLILWKQPFALYDAGFQLSFIAVLGVVWAGKIVQSAYQRHAVLQKIGTGFVLQLVILPVTAWYFYEIPVYAMLLNLLVLALGSAFGLFMKLLMPQKRSKDNKLIISVALLFAFCGVCALLDISPLLGCMMMGTVYTNIADDDKLFKQLNYFSPPILLLFFVRSGMSFQLDALVSSSGNLNGVPLLVIGVSYFLVRILGKYAGAWLGCKLVKKDKLVRNYLGLALIPQAGVAIGLAALGARTLGGTMGSDLQTIILASSVLYELIGPGCAKLALYLSRSYSTRLEDVAAVEEVTETGERKSDVQLLIERIQKIQSELPALDNDISEEEAAFTEAAEEQLAQTQAQRRFFYLRR